MTPPTRRTRRRNKTTQILDSHADACDAVARAAEKSADEVDAIKQRLKAIKDEARTIA